MFASRVLPPIQSPPSPPLPVATFFNVPRRYVKSNMQVGGDSMAASPSDDSKPPRSMRKTSRAHNDIINNNNDNTPRSATAPDADARAEQGSEPPSPVPSPRLSSKRTSSLAYKAAADDLADGANSSPNEAKTPPSTTSSEAGANGGGPASVDFPTSVCLCQPEPKIPRPRNAFILYRQHHQQNIIALHPGLNNPDISKIIGEQWKAESDEQKKYWQNLAQEEKARHHEQYPDYRYQPRRIGKPGSSPLNPTGQHTTVEKYRCPRCGGRNIRTPTSPFLDIANTPTLPPPNVSEGLTPTTRYLPMMSNLTIDSPALARRGTIPTTIKVSPLVREDLAMYSPLTPGLKRRRHDYGPPSAVRSSYYVQNGPRRDSLPPMQIRGSPPNTASMQPPRTPRESHPPSASADLKVLVPNQHDQSRSVEAMVMSLPYLARIKLLGRITPPLRKPSCTSPTVPVRGAIIAVEGDDVTAVRELTQWLNEFLGRDSAFSARIAEPPKGPSDDENEVPFEAYLDLIRDWHGRSKEMVKYITTPPPRLVLDAMKVDAPPSSSSTARKDSATPPDSPHPETTSSAKPIVLLPTFQLHASVAYASRIPIQDAYSPTDHWQWMATLWRGTVGPDLTLYVKTYDTKDGPPSARMVELDDEVRCLTVMKERDGRFTDAALRRVGFEVGEWIRGVGGTKAE